MLIFYARLSTKRANAVGGITDSYRHLREHGNSFFIVLLEILFGILIFAVSHVWGPNPDEARFFLVIGVVFFWIVPAVLVWTAATLLELQYSLAK